MGPSTYARVAEITSGRAISQQGLTATCKDRVHKEESEAGGGFWSGAWARRSDDGGVMPSEATREVVPTWGNTPGGQRSPGHWVANEPGPWEDMTGTARYNLPLGGRSWWRTSRPEGKPTGRCTTHLRSPTTWVASRSSRRGGRQTTSARGACGSALKLPHWWAGSRSDKWRAAPRSEPDSGNPTVRDRRAALRTVTSLAGGVLVRALNFEPDNRTHGSTGGTGNGTLRRHRASPRPNHPPNVIRRSPGADAPAPRAHQHQAPSQYLQPTPLGVARRTQRPDTRSPTSISAATWPPDDRSQSPAGQPAPGTPGCTSCPCPTWGQPSRRASGPSSQVSLHQG